MKKRLLFFFLALALASCQTATVSREKAPAPPPALTPNPAEPAAESERETVTPAPEAAPVPVAGQRPRLALILGPGGLRTYAHAGLLQELAKDKIPIFFVGGLEMGALPAALFALKGQPFEPEWQMMKLKEEDLIRKGLLSGSSPLKSDQLAGPLRLLFGGAKAEDAKISNMCTSYSVTKRQTFLMSRGPYSQMLQFCLPSLPLFENHQGNGANPIALAQLAHAARQKGAQLVVYVDLLTENAIAESDQGFMWGLFQQALETQAKAANEVVRVTGLPGLRAFDKRREMVQRGQEAGRRLVQLLQTKYGF